MVLKELCALRGVSGNEHEVRDFLLEKVRKTADEVRVDRMGNVLALKKADRADAPTILLVILAVTLLMGLLNLVLSVVLTVVNPIFGSLYTFFFSNIIGKQLSKAVFTSGIICGVVFLLGYFGCTVICVSAAALSAYIPLAIVLLLLWFLIGWAL